jgi:hypothetical protein
MRYDGSLHGWPLVSSHATLPSQLGQPEVRAVLGEGSPLMADLRPWEAVLVLAFAAVGLRLFLWRGVLFCAPASLRLLADSPPGLEAVPAELGGVQEALVGLGFVPLGTHLEHPYFGPRLLSFDYCLPDARTFASVSAGHSRRPRLYLMTPTPAGGFVVTADHRRPARAIPGHSLTGYLQGASPERLLKAHQRRVAEVGAADIECTLDGRVAAAKAWYRGAGQAEVRLQNVVGLLWTLAALGMVYAVCSAAGGW